MNIDKFYKPLEIRHVIIANNDQITKRNRMISCPYIKDATALEEKYKELLADKIIATVVSYSILEWKREDPMKELAEDIELLERHTGKTWEEIQEGE